MSGKADDEAKSSLVGIPLELIEKVCDYLGYKGIQKFRLTSKTWATAGMRKLVQSLIVIYTIESFEKLRNISKHPELSKFVRIIHYAPRILETNATVRYRYKYNAVAEAPSCVPRTDLERLRSSPGCIAFNQMFEKQRSMKRGEYSRRAFLQILPNFTGLIGFRVDPLCHYHQSLSFYSSFEPGESALVDVDTDEFREEALVFLAAAVKAGTKLQYLHLDNVTFNMLSGVSIDAGTIFQGLDRRYLRHLDISLTIYSADDISNANLVGLLQNSLKLEYLALTVSSPWYEFSQGWSDVTRSVTLPNLKTLKIYGTLSKSSTLAAFLKRHARTLKSLQMTSYYLHDDVKLWSEIFDAIQNDMDLHEVDLRGGVFSRNFYSSPAIPRGVDDVFIDLEHTYLGHSFESLLEDRLLNRNVLAQECKLTLKELWEGYVDYVTANEEEPLTRRRVCHSAIAWKWEDDEIEDGE
ncbi:hypothetical protein SBOR_5163 [Sclerotinia borealis F-4128]|uniref:F-box domain-containing protein n=1 Tax=Sclerotinia borealis (strain F-4128) TaxID=1432307 RepID=W9CIU7_SCLBF|nr:hypothetical protein SBOR_5163 [Sclerotinia borealis F-4128]